MRFFDTTLRDGEQTPGVSLVPKEKVRIAKVLDDLGVDVIEAGFAAASEGEFQAIKQIAKEGLKSEICSFTRGLQRDIDVALKADAQSIHLVIPTSDLHLEYKLKKTRKDILAMTEETVQYAKDHGLIVELSAEDGTRTEMDFLKEFFRLGVSLGCDRICPCDTVGILTPEKTKSFFTDLRKDFKTIISAHCHDDFGMAVANSVAALTAGADQVHVTVNGLGERAGNAALEETAVALVALYDRKLNIETKKLYNVSRTIAQITRFYPSPNKAIVGENAFMHESGIHTKAILSNPKTYEAISPDLVGVTRRLTVGKHAGSQGTRASLEQMGIHPTEEQLKEIFVEVKRIGDKGRRVLDSDLQVIAENVMKLPTERPIKLSELTVITGNTVTPTASVRLKMNGDEVVEAATGVGPVDAAMQAIRRIISIAEPIQLKEYTVEAITGGTDAVVDVSVTLSREGRIVTSRGVNEDIVMASVEAMLNGVNMLMTNRNRESSSEGEN